MADLTVDEIVEAISNNDELNQGVTNHIVASEKVQEIIGNKASSIYEEKIGDEVKKIHSQYDTDVLEVLGEKPGVNEDGSKVKSYDFIKAKLTELKGLRERANDLNKDAEVQRLTTQIEQLKKDGGGKHWEETHNTARATWLAKESEYKNQIQTLQDGQKTSAIDSDILMGLTGLNFNPDIPQAAVDALVNTVKSRLISSSKIQDGKPIYLDEHGKVIQDSEYKPQTAQGILKEQLKSVLLDENKNPGGEAQRVIKGTIQVTKVDGKDDKRELILDDNDFKSRSEFTEVVGKALAKEGIAKSDPDYQRLSTDAYNRYNVKDLPLKV